MENKPQYYPKELSWLAFNERVLQEAADLNNPVIERLRFLGLYSNNLDEFFRVRVAEIQRTISVAKNQDDAVKLEQNKTLLTVIQERINHLTKRFDKIHREVLRTLKKYNIEICKTENLSDFHKAWIQDYFVNKVLRHIAPIL